MDWLDRLANEAQQQESLAEARERENEAAIKQVFLRFGGAITPRFERYAATLKTSRHYPNAIARHRTRPDGSAYWDIANVGLYAIQLKLEGGAYHKARFYLTGYFDPATESTFGNASCDADEFSMEWLDAQMEPILRKALL